jgi:opacity protein-like surface antigen
MRALGMSALGFALTAGVFVIGSAQAQLLEPASAPTLQAEKPMDQVFGKIQQPFPRSYMSNETAPSIDKLHPNFRTDPKLVGGFELTPNLGIEAGFSNLYSQGFHYMDERHADERGGALGNHGIASHLAAKVTVPVDDRLSAYGKLGVAYSVRESAGQDKTLRDIDVGPYAGVGAKYKLTDKASLSGEYQFQGDTGKKWSNDTNANGFGAKLKLGF